MNQTQNSSAPPIVPGSSYEKDLLLAFLCERDIDCPRCGYNLRNLTQPVCPECREELRLQVGVQKIRLHWLVLSLAPGMFCAVATGLFVVICCLEGPPPPGEWEIWSIVAFLFGSGLAAVIVWMNSRQFLKLSEIAQRIWVAALWAIHVGALTIVLMTI